MRKAWRDFRRVHARGDESMSFGDWLRNAWRVAKAQRAGAIAGARLRTSVRCQLPAGLTFAAVPGELSNKATASACSFHCSCCRPVTLSAATPD